MGQIKNIFVQFFVQMRTRKFAFEIYWPLASLFARPNSPLEKSLKEAKKKNSAQVLFPKEDDWKWFISAFKCF